MYRVFRAIAHGTARRRSGSQGVRDIHPAVVRGPQASPPQSADYLPTFSHRPAPTTSLITNAYLGVTKANVRL